MLDERFIDETQRLERAWSRREPEDLREYLVQDVEDPRINIQSILTRHFLIERLFGDKHLGLMGEELRFAVVMNWLLKRAHDFGRPERVARMIDALLDGQEEVGPIKFPPFLLDAYKRLPIGDGREIIIPDYISGAMIDSQVGIDDDPIAQSILSTFVPVWRQFLEPESAEPLSVLEIACGSANDYRYIDRYGIGAFLKYRGIDLCEKNITNAREMLPEADFAVGNVLDIEAEDNTFDCCFLHDLLEHLSIEAMKHAISELCRVARQWLCIGCFNMCESDEHVQEVRHDYHWNRLSRARVEERFARFGAEVEAIHIDTFLRESFGFEETLNKGAYTLVVKLAQ